MGLAAARPKAIGSCWRHDPTHNGHSASATSFCPSP